jgi:hypothetical protein
MDGVSQFILHFIFILAFGFFFLLAVLLLKPLRFHQKRKISTAMLKFSYLGYLFIFLVYIYLFLFFQDAPQDMEDAEPEKKFNFFYLLLLFCFIIPNVGMLIRRRFKKWRTNYNYLFSMANLFIAAYLVLMIYITDWVFE